MDPIRNLPGIVGTPMVHDRGAGGRGNGGAFRRAMQEEQAGEGAEQGAAAQAAGPMRTGLQPRRVVGRKDDGAPLRHIDVLA